MNNNKEGDMGTKKEVQALMERVANLEHRLHVSDEGICPSCGSMSWQCIVGCEADIERIKGRTPIDYSWEPYNTDTCWTPVAQPLSTSVYIRITDSSGVSWTYDNHSALGATVTHEDGRICVIVTPDPATPKA